MAAFDPNKSKVKADQLATFLDGDVEESLTTVPGVGPANAKKLAAVGVTTTYQLIGVFLRLRAAGVSVQEHCDAFFKFIAEDAGISHYRHGIVKSVAEKANTMMFGLYDESALEGEHK